MARNRYLSVRIVLLLLPSLLAVRPALAAELQPKTVAAWETYVRYTEQRIAKELNDGRRFLVLDFRPAGEPQAVRSLLQRGQLDIWSMKTTREGGRGATGLSLFAAKRPVSARYWSKCTPCSSTFRRSERLNTWYPPLSVRIGLDHPEKR